MGVAVTIAKGRHAIVAKANDILESAIVLRGTDNKEIETPKGKEWRWILLQKTQERR